jgi:hypothetical protein
MFIGVGSNLDFSIIKVANIIMYQRTLSGCMDLV